MITDGRVVTETGTRATGRRIVSAFAAAAAHRQPREGADIGLHQRFCGKIFELSSALNTQRHLCRRRRFASLRIYPYPSGSDGAAMTVVSLAR